MPLTKIQSLGITDGTIVNADINASAAIAGTKISGSFGKVLQVVQTVKTDTYTSSATSKTDITGMSVSITPASASNKILVMFNIHVSNGNGNNQHVHLLRDSTEIFRGDTSSSRARATSSFYSHSGIGATAYYGMLNIAITYLDSPSTTSSVTYKVQHSSDEALQFGLNRSFADSDAASYARTVSSITVMEIAI